MYYVIGLVFEEYILFEVGIEWVWVIIVGIEDDSDNVFIVFNVCDFNFEICVYLCVEFEIGVCWFESLGVD